MTRNSFKVLIGVGVSLATVLGGLAAAPVAFASGATHAVGPVVNAGDVPPQDPSQSLPPNPNFTDDHQCGFSTLDDSDACNTDVVGAVNHARATLESLPALSLKLSAFEAMTVPQQLFVIADLERTDRGLPPIAGLTTQLDNVSQAAAANNDDPSLSASTLTGGASITGWGSLWAGGTSNPLGSDYYWMYDDGYGSDNTSCTSPSSPACWGHRDNILGTFVTTSRCPSGAEQYMGAGYAASGSSFGPSFAEIFVGACGATPTDVVFTWTQAQQLLSAGGGPDPTPPSVPQSVAAAPAAKKGVVLNWQAPADNGGSTVTGYKVYRGHKPGSEKLYATVSCTTSTCSYTNKHAKSKRMLFYQLAAVNGTGTGPLSAEVSARAL